MKPSILLTGLAIFLGVVAVGMRLNFGSDYRSETRKLEWVRDPEELRKISETAP